MTVVHQSDFNINNSAHPKGRLCIAWHGVSPGSGSGRGVVFSSSSPVPLPCAPTNGRPGFPFGFLGAGGRLPKARRVRFLLCNSSSSLVHHHHQEEEEKAGSFHEKNGCCFLHERSEFRCQSILLTPSIQDVSGVLVGRSYDTLAILLIWCYHIFDFLLFSFADRCQVVHGGSTDVEKRARPAHREEPPQIAETAGHTRVGCYIGLACLVPHLERSP